MALQFFRKHKKFFNILMIASVFAMMTFGTLWYADEVLSVVRGWVTGEDPRNPTVLTAYGEKVTWNDRSRIEQCLKAAGPLYMNPSLARSVIRLSLPESPILEGAYFNAARSDKPEDAQKVVHATAAVLIEAKKAGIVVSDEMLNAEIARWAVGGVTGEVLQKQIIPGLFEGNVQLFRETIRQEYTLKLYMDAVRQGAAIVEQDVWAMHRMFRQTASVRTLELGYEKYLDRIVQPTEAEVQAQFDKYKDFLPDTPDSPFGYKIPAKVAYDYLKFDQQAVAKTVVVTEKEIEDYYNSHKEEYVKPSGAAAPPAKDPATTSEPKDGPAAPSAEPTPGAGQPEAPPADDVKKDASGSATPSTDGVQPAKKLNAPDAPPPAAPAADQPAEPAAKAADQPKAAETPKADAPKTDTPAVDAPKADTQQPKEYLKLEEVSNTIRAKLVKEKADQETLRQAFEAVKSLQSSPQMKLENVADPKFSRRYDSGGLLSAKVIDTRPGIGQASVVLASGQSLGVKFNQLAFQVKPLVEKPIVPEPDATGPRVSEQVLRDAEGNCYIFAITAVEPARLADSLAEVKKEVVHDLQKVAAYRLAEKDAAEVLKELPGSNLVVQSRKVNEVKVSAPKDVHRFMAEMAQFPDPLAKAVFDRVDAGESCGQLPSPTYDKVVVFEILKVTMSTRDEYEKNLPGAVRGAVGAAQGRLLESFFSTDEIIRRSGLEVKEPSKGGRS